MNKFIDINNHMDCYQMVMSLVCKKFNKDFNLTFADSWDFFYTKASDIIDITSLSGKGKNHNNPFRYLGMAYKEIETQGSMEEINLLLEKHDILLFTLDSYYCPWHRGYMKAHIGHCFVIVDYNEEGCMCADPYLQKEKLVFLPRSNLIYGRGSYFYTTDNNSTQLNLELLLAEIASDEVNKINMFQMMEEYLSDLNTIKDPSILFDYQDDVYLCSITRSLKFIADGRIQLACLLKSLCTECRYNEDIVWICDSLFNSADLWNRINGLFIKLFYTPLKVENSMKKARTYLNEIIEKEKAIFLKIKQNSAKNI